LGSGGIGLKYNRQLEEGLRYDWNPMLKKALTLDEYKDFIEDLC